MPGEVEGVRPAVELAPQSVRVACRLWGLVAFAGAVALLAIIAADRMGIDEGPQPLLYRLIVQGKRILNGQWTTRLPGLDPDPRRLDYFLNRGFDDAFVIGSAAVALGFATVLGMAAFGLERGDPRARTLVLALCLGAAATFVAYGLWAPSRGAQLGVLVLSMLAALVPAALALDLLRQADRPGLPGPGRRNPFAGSLLLLVLSAHATLVVPALGCAWVLVGMLIRSAWLSWAS